MPGVPASISMPHGIFFFLFFFSVIRVATLLASLGPLDVLPSSIGFPLNPAPSLAKALSLSLSLSLWLYCHPACIQLLFICLFCQHLVVISAFLKLSTVTTAVHDFPLKVSLFLWFPLLIGKLYRPLCCMLDRKCRATKGNLCGFSHTFFTLNPALN